MFAEQPLAELRTDDVAREAGISQGLLFYYFPTKRAFYLAVVEAAAKRTVHLMRVPPEYEGDDAIRYGLEQYFDLVARRTDAYLLIARSAASSDPDVAAIWDQTRGRIGGEMLHALGTNNDHTRMLVRGWQAMVESIAIDWAREQSVDRDTIIDELVTVLRTALARSPKSQSRKATE